MFTGIIETTGIVRSLQRTAAGARLAVDAAALPELPAEGASLSIDGVCQTVARREPPYLVFDVIPETLQKTTLADRKPGDRVNLERSLRPGDRIDGHFVQGHVDGIATVVDRITTGEWRLAVEIADDALLDAIVPKGSIAIDGVSLTIARVDGRRCEVALIPTTLERTNLGQRAVGDRVNIETDILARTVVAFLRRQQESPHSRLTAEFLHEHGFIT